MQISNTMIQHKPLKLNFTHLTNVSLLCICSTTLIFYYSLSSSPSVGVSVALQATDKQTDRQTAGKRKGSPPLVQEH